MRQSIGSVILAAGHDHPGAPAVIDAAGTLSRAGLADRALSLARSLVDGGVRHDDTVVVRCDPGRGTVIACCAVWLAGARPMPLDPDLPVPDAVPAAAVLRAADIADVTDRPGGAAEGPVLPDLAASSWKAVATSGSTGEPKIVAATAPALVDPDRPATGFLPKDAVQLVTAPLHRSAPFTYAFRGLTSGHTLVLSGATDPAAWLTAVAEHRVTWTMTSPAFLHRLMMLPQEVRDRADLSSLETLLHIGAPCPEPLKRAVIGWLGPERVVEVYAGSESNGLTVIGGDEWLAHPGSVGRGSAGPGGTQVTVRDEAGHDLPAGAVGQVWLRRGTTPSYRYLGGRSRRDADGWDTLGDLGFLDGDGYLHIVGRAADVVVREGVPSHPSQTEATALLSPRVRDAVAFGFPGADGRTALGVVVETDGDPPPVPGADHVWAVTVPLRDATGKTSRRAWAARLCHRDQHQHQPGLE
jgi:bile acid-coenzyme A ligase